MLHRQQGNRHTRRLRQDRTQESTLIQAKDVPRTHITVIKIPVVETSVGGVEAINIPELNTLQKMNCATIAR